MADLVFQLPLTGSADLVFGADSPPPGVSGDLAGTLGGLTGSVAAAYDNAVWRGVAVDTASPWQPAAPRAPGLAAPWGARGGIHAPRTTGWGDGHGLPARCVLAWAALVPARPRTGLAWNPGRLAAVATGGRWVSLTPAPQRSALPWNPGRLLAPSAVGCPYVALTLRPVLRGTRWQPGRPQGVDWRARFGPALARRPAWRLPWNRAGQPPPGTSPGPGTPPEPPAGCYRPPPGAAVDLVFRVPLADPRGAIVFRCPSDRITVTVPVLRVYRVRNSFSLARIDDGTPVDALAFGCALDADAWTWSWSARIPGAQLERVLASTIEEPVELLATLNGTPLHLVAENLTRERRFGGSTIRLSGRGRNAWLAAPYSPVLTVASAADLTAQQCAALALEENGVPIGWDLDWQLEDWLVAAGAWNHTGTHLEAVARVAEAGGGYLQPHDTDPVLRLLPRYPLAPWDWDGATPDLALPEDVVTLEGIEWLSRPAYDAVYVAGSAAGGRLDRIRRTGSAGNTPAPTVVDPLATDPVMTRQRGLAILADTGRQAHLSLRLPVLQETGIVRPGTLVRYTESGTERLGLCRGVAVTWAFPAAWQTLKVETHESV